MYFTVIIVRLEVFTQGHIRIASDVLYATVIEFMLAYLTLLHKKECKTSILLAILNFFNQNVAGSCGH